MPESETQANPNDERTPEQWAQFRQAEANNQENQTRRLDPHAGKKPIKLEVQNIKHGLKSPEIGAKNG